MSNTNLDDAIKLLSELRIAEDIPTYYKPVINKIITTLINDVREERHGHWIHIEEGKITDCSNAPVLWKCSYCHTPFVALVDRYHYCPHCGASMDEVKE